LHNIEGGLFIAYLDGFDVAGDPEDPEEGDDQAHLADEVSEEAHELHVQAARLRFVNRVLRVIKGSIKVEIILGGVCEFMRLVREPSIAAEEGDERVPARVPARMQLPIPSDLLEAPGFLDQRHHQNRQKHDYYAADVEVCHVGLTSSHTYDEKEHDQFTCLGPEIYQYSCLSSRELANVVNDERRIGNADSGHAEESAH
jgi:hypothetical protein